MFGFDAKAARATWTVAVMLAAAWAIWAAREILIIALIAMFFAYALHPIVLLVQRFVKGPSARAWALGLVYSLLLGAIVTGGAVVVSQAAQEIDLLSKKVPEWIQNRDKLLNIQLPGPLEPYRDQALALLKEKAGSAAQQAAGFLQAAGTRAFGLVGNLLFVLLIPILSFLMMRDADQFRDWLLQSFPNSNHQGTFEGILGEVNRLLSGYMRALSTMAGITWVVYWIGLAAMGMPYAYLLAIVAGLAEFIPVLGPLVAASAVILTGLLTGHPVGLAIGFMVIYRLVLDYVILPWQMKETVDMHPLVTLIGALAGEQMAGVIGLFLSVPVLATLNVLLQVLTKRGLIHFQSKKVEVG